MKKFNTSFLSLLLVFSVITALSPVKALADEDHGEKDKKENHGFFVRMVAKTKSLIGDMGNHGSAVRETAKSEYGKKSDDEDENENENGQEQEENDHGQNQSIDFNRINSTAGTSTATISWQTNVLTSGQVLFGTTSQNFDNSASETGSLSLAHNINLTNLLPDTTYFYVIKATNASSSVATSSVKSFKTLAVSATDTKAPTVLFSTTIGLNASTTRILWLTNESSIGKIWVDTSSSVSTSTTPTVTADTFGYFHILNIPNLATSTKYYYVISSTDASGNTSYYSDSFTSPSN